MMSSQPEITWLKGYCRGRGVNIGCGGRPFDGAINVDMSETADADMIADAAALPFVSNRFDYVVSSHCLEHVDAAPLTVLLEWLRILKVGGFLAFIVPDGSQGLIAMGPKAGVFEDGRHIHAFTIESLQTLLEFAGAMVVELKTLERPEWKTRTILAVARKDVKSKDVAPGSLRARSLWAKGVYKTVTWYGLAKWLRSSGW